MPPLTTWTIPKFDTMVVTFLEKLSKVLRDYHWLKLIRIYWGIKDFLGSIYWIHNNNDSIDIRKECSLIYATSYYKKFCFCKHDFNHVIFCFDNRIVVTMDIGYGSGNLIFNTSIRYNDYWIEIWWCLDEDVIKSSYMMFDVLIITPIY